MKCAYCGQDKKYPEDFVSPIYAQCWDCWRDDRPKQGIIFVVIGKFLRKQRIKRGLTLRAFCKLYHLDPVTISKIERGYYFKIAPEDKGEPK